MNINQIVSHAHILLKKANIRNPRLEANLIISETLKINLDDMPTKTENLNNQHTKNIFSKIDRRIKGEPYAYIIGNKPFYNLNIIVDKNVLIPRPETEHIIETALANIQNIEDKINIIDIGVGSGAILCTLLDKLPNAYGIGTDISEKALMIAKKNIKKYKLNHRSNLINTSWGNSVKSHFFDLLTCNPPYVSEKSLTNLQKEVKYEPLIALNGGEKGLGSLRDLLPSARKCLKLQGKAFFEIGYNQCNSAQELISNSHFRIQNVIKDLAGIERVIFATAI